MQSINERVSKNLLRIRKDRKLSLDQTAKLTGVSKAMLGQIERGETNPTVTTLWKIANGLHLSFSSLFKEDAATVTIISKNNLDAIAEGGGGYRVYPVIPFSPKRSSEVYKLEIDPGCTHFSEPHHAGVEEFLTVGQGTLDLKIESEEYTIGRDDSILFQADRPHTYYNRGTEMVKCVLIIHYPTA